MLAVIVGLPRIARAGKPVIGPTPPRHRAPDTLLELRPGMLYASSARRSHKEWNEREKRAITKQSQLQSA